MRFRIKWESLGVATSVACAIHCAVLPLFISSLPLFGVNLVHNVFVEMVLLGAAFVIGFSTLWHGYKKHHHHWGTLIPFIVAMGLFVCNQLIHFRFSSFIFIVPAVALITTAHILNNRFCRKANHCHSTDCNH